MPLKIQRESGVRRYLKRSLAQRMGQWWVTRRIGAMGEGVFVGKSVRLMRHPEKIRLGSEVILKAGARLCPTNPEAEVSIGDNTTIGYHTYLFATTSIVIGNNCLVAPFCYVVDSNHGIYREQLIREQPMSAAPVLIRDDVWLGTGAVVLKGVSIGTGAVIGAGSVVADDVPEYAIVSGNPGAVVDFRRERDSTVSSEVR